MRWEKKLRSSLEMPASAVSRCNVFDEENDCGRTIDQRRSEEWNLGGGDGDDFIIPLHGSPPSMLPRPRGEDRPYPCWKHKFSGALSCGICSKARAHRQLQRTRGRLGCRCTKKVRRAQGTRDPAKVHTPAGLVAVRTPLVAQIWMAMGRGRPGKCSPAWITLTGNGGQCCHR